MYQELSKDICILMVIGLRNLKIHRQMFRFIFQLLFNGGLEAIMVNLKE